MFICYNEHILIGNEKNDAGVIEQKKHIVTSKLWLINDRSVEGVLL